MNRSKYEDQIPDLLVEFRDSDDAETREILLDRGYPAEFVKELLELIDSYRFARRIGIPVSSVMAEQSDNSGETDFSEHLSQRIGTSLAALIKYQLKEAFSFGGMGLIVRAQDETLDREVAIKIPKDDGENSCQKRALLNREAIATGRLQHPGITPVYSFGVTDGKEPFYAMKLLDGETLRSAIGSFFTNSRLARQDTKSNRPILSAAAYRDEDFRKLLQKFVQVCQAVEYAHSRGVFHLDLKPENVMLCAFGETVVLDWGGSQERTEELTRAASERNGIQPEKDKDDSERPPSTYSVTLEFAAPEQLRSDFGEIGPTTDVYGLGGILFALLTELGPTQGFSKSEIYWRAGREPVRLASSLQPHVPRPLEAICKKALAASADCRYRSCSELRGEIERYLADERVEAHKEQISEYVRRWTKKHPTKASMAALSLVMFSLASIIGFAAVSYWNDKLRDANVAISKSEQQEKREREKANERLRNFVAASGLLREVFNKMNPESATAGDGALRTELLENLKVTASKISAAELGDADEILLLKASLANALLALGDPDSSALLWEEIVEVVVRIKGPKSKETVEAKINLAFNWLQGKRAQKAQDLLIEVQDVAKDLYPDNDLVRLSITHYIATAQERGGYINEALEIRESLMSQLTNSGQQNSILWLDSLNSLGVLYHKSGDFSEAGEAYQEVLEIQQRYYPEEHPIILKIKMNLLLTEARTDRAVQAIASMRNIVEEVKAKYPIYSPVVGLAMFNLADMVRENDGAEEAAVLYGQLINGPYEATISAQSSVELAVTKIWYQDLANDGVRDLERLVPELEQQFGPDSGVALRAKQYLERAAKENR